MIFLLVETQYVLHLYAAGSCRYSKKAGHYTRLSVLSPLHVWQIYFTLASVAELPLLVPVFMLCDAEPVPDIEPAPPAIEPDPGVEVLPVFWLEELLSELEEELLPLGLFIEELLWEELLLLLFF
jgi:hypothetical protein